MKPSITSTGRRGYTAVPNFRTEHDPSLDIYARTVAMWLSSHTDSYVGSVSRNAISRRVGISQGKVTQALADLERVGLIEVERNAKGLPNCIVFNVEVWESPGGHVMTTTETGGHDVTTRPVEGGHVMTSEWSSRDHKEEQGETQELETQRSAPASPKTEAHRIVDAWWESLTLKPAQPYIAIVKVVQQCLKNGWSDELIASALREAPVVSGAAFDLWRNNREARGTDEPWITELLALSAPFFDGRDLLTWRHANVDALRATIRTLGHWGFDRGETMIRIAVAARHPQDMTNPTKLAKLPRIDRFKGLPDDLSDAMERAYRNLGWRAS
jgi:DNA-binding transcriptional ArsR family regulator